jgi:hypothetical protein
MTNINQTESRRSFRRIASRVLNCLTVLLLLGVAGMAGAFFLIYINPYLSINPFPPPTLPSTAFVPSPTVTNPLNLPPTWTATNIPPPTATDTLQPTIEATMPASSTPFSLVTPTITLTETRPPAGYPYNIQTGSPYAIANLYYPDKGCDWMGVGGQVVDMSGAPVTGLIIRLGGTLPGVQLSQPMLSLTGVSLNYGQSGYEFTLADRPIASRNSLWLQLLDQAGIPLSDKFYFNTFDTCDKNLIIVNFKQVR